MAAEKDGQAIFRGILDRCKDRYVRNTCKSKFNSHAVKLAGAQEIPSDLEPILFMDAVHADLEAACPTGIDKCECMHAPGRCSQKVITLKRTKL